MNFKLIASFKINHCGDRSDLLAILGTAGYLVKLREEKERNSCSTNYFVDVYQEVAND